jgi:hypothetical protein
MMIASNLGSSERVATNLVTANWIALTDAAVPWKPIHRLHPLTHVAHGLHRLLRCLFSSANACRTWITPPSAVPTLIR